MITCAEQPKAFILVKILTPKKRGDNFPKNFCEEVEKSFDDAEHPGLNLMSIDVVMGVDFSVIVQVYFDDLHIIGKFVKEYKRRNDSWAL